MINIVVIILIILLLYLYKFRFYENYNDFNFIRPNNWSKLGFNDKLVIYGKQLNKNYSLFADKYNIKFYVKNLNIKDLYITKTLKVLDKNTDLKLHELPKNCIIKSNCGSGDVIIIKDSKIVKMIARNQKTNTYNEWKKKALVPLNWRPELEPHYKFIKPIIFVEEYLGNNLNDYKFFCINGKVIFMLFIDNIEKCRNIYDTEFNLQPYKKKYNNCSHKVKKPKNFYKMIKIAENLSKPFPFVRIDLYNINNKIYFGEYTFVPAAAEKSHIITPLKYDKLIGSYFK